MERIGRIINKLAILNQLNTNCRLKDYSITSNEASVLMSLKRKQEIHQDDLVKELQVDKSAVTRLIHKMEDKGLIKRKQDSIDRRQYIIKMTNKGKQKQELIDDAFNQKDIDLVKNLSSNEQQELRRMLNIIKENLGGSSKDE